MWEWVDQYGHRIHDQLRRLGSSVDWSRTAFTMDEKLSVSGAGVMGSGRSKRSDVGASALERVIWLRRLVKTMGE